MRIFRNPLIGVARSAIWPAYLFLASYAARQAPWPKPLAMPVATVLAMLALGLVCMRFAWRFGNELPALAGGMPEWQQVAARFVHLCFYALMFALPVSGTGRQAMSLRSSKRTRSPILGSSFLPNGHQLC